MKFVSIYVVVLCLLLSLVVQSDAKFSLRSSVARSLQSDESEEAPVDGEAGDDFFVEDDDADTDGDDGTAENDDEDDGVSEEDAELEATEAPDSEIVADEGIDIPAESPAESPTAGGNETPLDETSAGSPTTEESTDDDTIENDAADGDDGTDDAGETRFELDVGRGVLPEVRELQTQQSHASAPGT